MRRLSKGSVSGRGRGAGPRRRSTLQTSNKSNAAKYDFLDDLDDSEEDIIRKKPTRKAAPKRRSTVKASNKLQQQMRDLPSYEFSDDNTTDNDADLDEFLALSPSNSADEKMDMKKETMKNFGHSHSNTSNRRRSEKFSLPKQISASSIDEAGEEDEDTEEDQAQDQEEQATYRDETKIKLSSIDENKAYKLHSNVVISNEKEKVVSNAGDNNSVFTEKKQDDIDKLFEDLLGSHPKNAAKNKKDVAIDFGENVSVASSAMSSVMPVITANITKRRSSNASSNSAARMNHMSGDTFKSRKIDTNTPTNSNNFFDDDEFSAIDDNSSTNNNESYLAMFSSGVKAKNANEFIHKHQNPRKDIASVAATSSSKYSSTQTTTDENIPIEERFYKIYTERRKRMLHLRAAFTLFILVAIMFAIVQFTSVQTYNRHELKSLRNEYRAFQNNLNIHRGSSSSASGSANSKALADADEGQDRPILTNQVDTLQLKASSSGLGRMSRGRTISGYVNVDEHQSKQEQNKPKEKQEPKKKPKNDSNGPVDVLFSEEETNQAKKKKDQEKAAAAAASNKANPKKNQIQMPDSFENFANIKTPDNDHIDIPFLWQVPMAGAKTIRDILSNCLGVTLACEKASIGAYSTDKTLEVFTMDNAQYINVDTTYIEGIQRGKKLNLIQSPLVNVIVSPYVHEISTLFTSSHNGRMFAVLRHPIYRAASTYQFLKRNDKNIAKMSFVEYASSGRIENNWMVRFLSNHHSGEVTMEHLILAKEVLRTKCIVGIEDKLWASLKRFEQYFNWQYTTDPKRQFECRKDVLIQREEYSYYPSDKKNDMLKEGSQIWTLILWQNKFDMKLFQFAEQLFVEQAKMFPGIPMK